MTSAIFKDYFGRGTLANRPAAGTLGIPAGTGAQYYATDTKTLYEINAAGTGWDAITGGGGSGGGGAQVASWGQGNGARQAIIRTVATGSYNGNPIYSIGAEPRTNFYWTGGADGDGRTLTWDFGRAVLFQGLSWQQDFKSNNGTWAVEGSDDNVAFTQFGTMPITVDGYYVDGSSPHMLPICAMEFPTNTTTYRYIRIRLIAGGVNGSDYVTHFTFKITPF